MKFLDRISNKLRIKLLYIATYFGVIFIMLSIIIWRGSAEDAITSPMQASVNQDSSLPDSTPTEEKFFSFEPININAENRITYPYLKENQEEPLISALSAAIFDMVK